MKEKLTKKQQAFCRHFARTRNGREAAAAAGFSVFPETAAARLLGNPNIQKYLHALEQETEATKAELIAGYRRLAFGSVADAVRLLLTSDGDAPLDPETLDLFLVSEIKRSKAGGLEIKFFDRQKALDRLSELLGGNTDGALPFYAALEASAKALKTYGEADE
ncbi:MAG TPA: terminase small subunit [Candidatus Fimenecus excrementavium]|nr:terminase small subunit [Candidatus Fimenecus excrementavium]